MCADFVRNLLIRKALRDAFGLGRQKVMWATDEHYNFGADEVDPADIDE